MACREERDHVHMTSAPSGGEGGRRIGQFCGRTVLIGCVKCGQGGGRGSKGPKILLTSYVHGPLSWVSQYSGGFAGTQELQHLQTLCYFPSIA